MSMEYELKIRHKSVHEQLFGGIPLTPGTIASEGAPLHRHSLKQGEEQPTTKKKADVTPCINFICSLRTKMCILFSAIVLVAVILFVIILMVTFPISFATIEKEDMISSGKRVINSIYEIQIGLLKSNLLQAAWNETYDVIQQTVDEQTTEDYLHDNYKKELLRSLKLNWVLMYDIDGHLLFNRTAYLDPSNDTEVPIPSELLELPSNVTAMMSDIYARVGGFLIEEATQRIIIFTASPVLTDDLTGPSVGCLFFARYVEKEYFLKDLASATQQCVSFHVPQDTSDSFGQSQINSAKNLGATRYTFFDLTAGAPKLNDLSFDIHTLPPSQRKWHLRKCPSSASNDDNNSDNEKVVSGIFLNDISGQHALLLLVDSNRVNYYTGITSLIIAFVFCIVICLTLAVLILGFLECFVLFPVIGLSKQMQKIEQSQDTSVRMQGSKVSSKQDEIGRMLSQINKMLESLDEARKRQKEEETRLQAYLQRIALEEEKSRSIMNSIPDFVVIVTNPEGCITFTNQTMQDTLQYSEIDLHNLRIDRLLDSKLFAEKQQIEALLHIRDAIIKFNSEHKEFETFVHNKVGEKIPVVIASVQEMQMFVGQNSEQSIPVLLLFLRNMSEKKKWIAKLEKEKQVMNEEMAKYLEFETMFSDPEMLKEFKEYCHKEQSSENIMFIEEIRKYKKLKRTHERVAMQQEIVNNFCLPDSPYALNISIELLKSQLFQVQNHGVGQLTLFDDLELQVRKMVIIDTFRRFNIHWQSVLAERTVTTHHSSDDAQSRSSLDWI